MNAIELLKSDHQTVAELFEDIKANEDGDNRGLFERVKAELDVHAHIEETIFYPKLKEQGNEELKDIVLEGIEEHRQIKMFLAEIAALMEGSEKFDPKLKVLIEDVEHHVKEEEDEMFPLVESQFDSDFLNELGAAIAAEKKQFDPKSTAKSAG